MRFSAINLGCKVNAFETESVAGMLEQRGHTRVEPDEDSDACLIFTCAVTNTAAAKSRQMIHRMRKRNPDAVLVVAGCYAQIDPGALKSADVLVGNAHKMNIPDYIDSFRENHIRISDPSETDRPPFEPMVVNRFEHQTRAYLRIQDGCNQFCTYCVIPYARGRERSMDPDMAVREAVRLSKQHHEIVLTGIHTGRYGREHGVTLAQLMKRILHEADELQRLRISSIEITELDDEFVELMKNEPRIARHLHIPVQSGSDRILELMHRPYDTNAYYNRVEEIRAAVADLSVSCDLMTGFPSETDEDHQDALAFLRKCGFSFMHVFPYSMREGTAAAAMKQQIPSQIKKQRTADCIALSQELYDAYKASWLNRTAEVMCETVQDGWTRGYTSQYIPVKIEGEFESGSMVPTVLTDLKDHQVYGKRNYETDGII
ncbi:MAG: tRNA (N(6)-L-threonylcarbamoyladenosine(37)-C(2))-methylthiotransferase MtaB [Solobacterium sp.]|nr:tRNA (N(6)-L-threonylcarbamoyladenosine(37)-C(2))-methylthiotransferase MtaB [Solobacterium sp.]